MGDNDAPPLPPPPPPPPPALEDNLLPIVINNNVAVLLVYGTAQIEEDKWLGREESPVDRDLYFTYELILISGELQLWLEIGST